MRQTCGAGGRARRVRGGARLNFLIVMTILVAVGYIDSIRSWLQASLVFDI
jgi:hypothetical protein